MAKKKTSKTTHHHTTHKKKTTTKKNTTMIIKSIAIIAIIIAIIAVITYFSRSPTTTITTKGTAPITAAGDFGVSQETKAAMKTLADDDPYLGAEDAPVTIVEFSDFQCPFCKRFREQTFNKIKENFIDTGIVKFVYRDLPLSFHPYAQKAAEAAQCAHEQGKFWEYHDKLFENQQQLDENSLKKYAADLGLDVEAFTTCLDSGKYEEETLKDAQAAAGQGIGGTPGFIINGKKISGAQPYDKFEQVICSIVPESEPCKDIPPPVAFVVTIVNDKNCKTCDTTRIKQVTTELFPGVTYKEIDASTPEGQALIKKHQLTYAPAYLFPETVTQTKTWQNNERLRTAFIKTSDGYRLRDEAVGAQWFFSEEEREAHLARINEALGRETNDNKPQVDFFVMSYCPYGNQAEELLKPVYDKLKGQAYFKPHYVIYDQGQDCYTDEDGTKLCSLHGGAELNQDIRELCVYNEYGEEEWFAFALAMNEQCNAQNADTCWEDVAQQVGLDVDKIKQCFDENKITYARQEYELNKLLGVTGSPTLFFEGEQYNGPRSSNAFLAALCNGFDERPAACDEALEETTTTTSTTAGCGA